MRGEDRTSGAMFSYVDVEARIAAKHPLRAMRADRCGAGGSRPGFFVALRQFGRPSIPPERLLRTTLLLYSIRSERRLVGRIAFDMLLR